MRLKGKKPIFNNKDTWNLDSTMSPIIAEGLKKFKEVILLDDNCAGYPITVLNDDITDPMSQHAQPGLVVDDEHGVAVDKNYEKLEDENFVKWIEIIDKMIYAFEGKAPEIPDGIYGKHSFGDPDENGNRSWDIEILDQDKKDKHMEADEKHHQDVQDGLNLFAKYYKNLWW